MCRDRGYTGTLSPSAQFCCGSKTALKNKVFLIKKKSEPGCVQAS